MTMTKFGMFVSATIAVAYTAYLISIGLQFR